MHRYEHDALWVGLGDGKEDDPWTSSSAIVRSVTFHPLDHMVAFAAKKRVVVFKHRSRGKGEEKAETGENSNLGK